MSDLFWLSNAQMARLEPFFPKSHGKPRIDVRHVLSSLPKVDLFREALKGTGIRACIPGRKQCKKTDKFDKRRNRFEFVFGRLKDWRRVATCNDRCPTVFLQPSPWPLSSFACYESSGNFWSLPSELKEGSHFWLVKLMAGSNHETLCRTGPVDGQHAGLHRR